MGGYKLLPGQYYDSETNTHQNYFRDYDPSIGRYVESDPMGLRGGIHTYSYVQGNPVSRIDPRGQLWGVVIGAAAGGWAGYVAGGNWQSAVIGAGAGALVGILAPQLATQAGYAAGQAGSFASFAAAGSTYLGVSGSIGAGAVMEMNYVNGNPWTEGVGYGVAAGVIVPLSSGEAAVSAAGGAEALGIEAAIENTLAIVGGMFGIISSYMDPGATHGWSPHTSARDSQEAVRRVYSHRGAEFCR